MDWRENQTKQIYMLPISSLTVGKPPCINIILHTVHRYDIHYTSLVRMGSKQSSYSTPQLTVHISHYTILCMTPLHHIPAISLSFLNKHSASHSLYKTLYPYCTLYKTLYQYIMQDALSIHYTRHCINTLCKTLLTVFTIHAISYTTTTVPYSTDCDVHLPRLIQ